MIHACSYCNKGVIEVGRLKAIRLHKRICKQCYRKIYAFKGVHKSETLIKNDSSRILRQGVCYTHDRILLDKTEFKRHLDCDVSEILSIDKTDNAEQNNYCK